MSVLSYEIKVDAPRLYFFFKRELSNIMFENYWLKPMFFKKRVDCAPWLSVWALLAAGLKEDQELWVGEFRAYTLSLTSAYLHSGRAARVAAISLGNHRRDAQHTHTHTIYNQFVLVISKKS